MTNQELVKNVTDTLNVAYRAWRTNAKADSTKAQEALVAIQRTHDFVLEYIDALLNSRDVIPLIGRN